MTTEAVRTLGNVLADAFALHENSPGARSLVRQSEPDGDEHWLDFEHAGEVAAAALEIAGLAPDGRQLFMIPARLSAPPETSGARAGVDAPPARAVHHEGNLVGQLIGASREIFSKDPVRHRWLLTELRRYRPGGTLAELHALTDYQLSIILEKIEGHRAVKRLEELDPGVHQPTGGAS